MKAPTLSTEEIQKLSHLLLSSNGNSIEVGFQILHSYNNIIPIVNKELILISQLSWNESQRQQAYSLLEQHYPSSQLEEWNKTFHIFHIYNHLFDAKDFETNWHWFEFHETKRHLYMPFITKNAEYAGEYFAIGETIAEYYKKRLDWAELYYKIPLEHNAEDLNVLITLANLYRDGYHDYPKALEYYDKMLSLEETHYDALESKGLLLFDYLKKTDEAIAVFKAGLEAHPKDENLRIWLADAYMASPNSPSYPLGKEMITTILKNNPNNPLAWSIYGNRLWLSEHQPKEAEKAYHKALEYHPQNYNILGNLGELYDVVYQDYEQAKAYYIKAFSIYMDDAFHLSNFIKMLVLCTGELEDAKDYYMHLQSLCFGSIKQEPEASDLQWQQFKKAEAILLQKYPELKEH